MFPSDVDKIVNGITLASTECVFINMQHTVCCTVGYVQLERAVGKIVKLECFKLERSSQFNDLPCINKNLERTFQLNNLSNCSFKLHAWSKKSNGIVAKFSLHIETERY